MVCIQAKWNLQTPPAAVAASLSQFAMRRHVQEREHRLNFILPECVRKYLGTFSGKHERPTPT